MMKIERLLVHFVLCILCASSGLLQGQICNGNLGTNIFEAGDFGSGTDNILQADPEIAPGYSYVNTPPPSDGSYIITNSIAQWSSRFDWPAINSDNSNDPDGYMMVVNASFDAGVFYRQQIDGLCENTLYVFSADVLNIHPTGRNYIKPNVSFAIDEEIAFSTGDVPESGEWTTYGFTFTTDPGVTSISLSLVNNAPGGIGNDLALDNITFRACGPEALILPESVADICEDGDPITLEATVNGDQYDDIHIQWQESLDQGMTWQNIPQATELTYEHTQLNAGYYYYRYLLAGAAANLQNDKCRINSNVKVINVIPKFYSVVDTLCDGLTFSLGDRSIGTTGTFTESLKNSIGCDSIVTLDLTIVEDPDIQIDFIVQDPSCVNYTDGSIGIDNITNGIGPFAIYTDGELSFNNGMQANLESGSYTYRLVDKFGCTADTSIALNDPDPFEIDLGGDQIITIGDTAVININSNYIVEILEWNVDDVDCALGCMELILTPLQSFDLGVRAISEYGCSATDLINIQVDKLRPVYMPNAITPDADGVNDLFTIYGDDSKVIEIEELVIYDRWSNVLYEKKNFPINEPSLGWDGMFRGSSLSMGTYLYVAHVKFIDNEIIQYAGSISIVR